MTNSIRATLASGVLVGAITAVVMAPTSAAPALGSYNYNCPGHGYCQNINGPNENPIDYNEGFDYEMGGNGTCSTIWKYNGGSNYNAEAHDCTSLPEISHECSKKVNGHGQVTSPAGGGILAGHQDNSGRC